MLPLSLLRRRAIQVRGTCAQVLAAVRTMKIQLFHAGRKQSMGLLLDRDRGLDLLHLSTGRRVTLPLPRRFGIAQ
jgi:hypothetical protein